jgi:aminoglycoside 6'-N-acetyltransferase I
MRHALWPDGSIEEHALETERMLSRTASSTPLIVFVAELDGRLIGFIEIGIRSHADGCNPLHHVGYVEGWYVDETHRQQGIGRALMHAAEHWSREHGCLEIASDALIENIESQHAHEALGYVVVDRCVHYRKPLN